MKKIVILKCAQHRCVANIWTGCIHVGTNCESSPELLQLDIYDEVRACVWNSVLRQLVDSWMKCIVENLSSRWCVWTCGIAFPQYEDYYNVIKTMSIAELHAIRAWHAAITYMSARSWCVVDRNMFGIVATTHREARIYIYAFVCIYLSGRADRKQLIIVRMQIYIAE